MLCDANGIPVGVAHYDPLLYTRLYEVEYMDFQRSAFSANKIATNMFAQVDKEVNQYALLDTIVNHHTNE